MPTSPELRKAVRHLKKSDPVMARVIADVGPCRFQRREFGSYFDALCRSIVFQQLSTKAATTIHNRFLDLFPSRHPEPELLLSIEVSRLRGVGLSTQKTSYIRDLAERVHTGALPLDHLDE